MNLHRIRSIITISLACFAAIIFVGFMVIPPGTFTQTNVPSVEQFYLSGDIDDSAAINRATAWSLNNGNACVGMLAKTYIASSIVARGCLKGQGIDSTIIQQAAGASELVTTNGGTGTLVGFTLSGMTLNGNASNVPAGVCVNIGGTWSSVVLDNIRVTNCYYRNVQFAGTNADVTNNTLSRVSNCRIDHAGHVGHGITLITVNNFKVLNCEIDSNSAFGISVEGTGDPITVQSNHVEILGNIVHDNSFAGVNVYSFNISTGAFGPMAGPGASASYVLIHSNEIYSNSGGGLGYDGRYGIITANSIHDNVGDGMLFNAIDSEVLNNAIFSNSSFGLDAGGCVRCKISENKIYLNSTDGTMGINISSSVDSSVSGNSVFGNGGQQINAGLTDNGNCVGAPCTYSVTALPTPTTRLNIERNKIIITGAHNGITLLEGTSAVVRGNSCTLGSGSAGDSAAANCYKFISSNIESDQNTIILNSTGIDAPLPIASAATTVIPDGGINFSITGTATITALQTTAQNSLVGKVAQVIVDGGGAMATSATSLSVGTGSKSLVTQAGLNLTVGHTITIATPTPPVKSMTGTVTSYNNGTGALVVNVTSIIGTGTFNSWIVGIPSDVTCALSAGGGSGAIFYPNMNANGVVIGCKPIANGSGYTSPPTCALSGGGLTGATCHSLLGVNNNLGRTIRLTFANSGVKIKNGNGVNLASGTDYTSSATGWLVLIGDASGNWNEVSRSGAPGTSDNRVVNPCMYFDQRKEGALLGIQQGFAADQWWSEQSGGFFYTAQRILSANSTNDPSPDCSAYMQLTVGATHTPGATETAALFQAISGGNIADLIYGTVNAKSLILDFCARSSVSATYSWALQNPNAVKTYVASYTIGANAPTCYSFVVPGDTTGFTDITPNGVGLRLFFDLGSGANTLTATSGQWIAGLYRGVTGEDAFISKANGSTLFISGVRLYPSNQDVPWIKKSYSEELNIVKQYYQKTFPVGTAPAQSAGLAGALCALNPVASGQPSLNWRFDPPLVKSPTITTYNPSAANANWRNVTAPGDVAVSVDPSTALGLTGVEIAAGATVATGGQNLCIHATADPVFNY